MLKVLRKKFSFLRLKEPFLFIETGPEFIRGVLVKLDPFARSISVIRPVSLKTGGDLLKIQASIIALLKKFQKYFFKSALIFFEPPWSATFQSGIVLMRKAPEQPITESELDELVAQGIWRVFDRERTRQAERLKMSDVDAYLADAQLVKIKLDGHQVVNPIDFSARTIELHCRETITPRILVENLHSLLADRPIGFLEESGAVYSELVRRSGIDSFLFILMKKDSTHFFIQHEGSFSYQDSCNWGLDNLIDALSAALGTTASESTDVFNVITEGKTSQSFYKKAEHILNGEFSTLLKAAAGKTASIQGVPAYLYSPLSLPGFFYEPNVARRFGFSGQIFRFDEKFIGEKFNFEVPYKQGILEKETFFKIFAGMVYFQTIAEVDAVGRIARRRLRWLQNSSARN